MKKIFLIPIIIILFLATANTVSAGQTVDEIQQMISKPLPQITIPGLQFSEPQAVEEEGGIYLYLPFIGEYLAAFYKWAVVAIGILAVIRLMYAGFGWLMSGGSAEKITAAKKQITSAIIGLLIAIGSYTLLYTINPALVEFKSLKVLYVTSVPLDNQDVILPGQSYSTNLDSGQNITKGNEIKSLIGEYKYPPCSKEGAQWAAKQLYDKSICVGSCFCATSVSAFLNYVGCTNLKDGTPTLLAIKLEKSGWITEEITLDNYKNLPIGLIINYKHAGVSIGDGKNFESTNAKNAWEEMNNKNSELCPADQDAAKDSKLCSKCAKIPNWAPSTGLYFGGNCEHNQTWFVKNLKTEKNKESGKSQVATWNVIAHPPTSNSKKTPNVTCCFKIFGANRKEILSQALCDALNESKICD